MVNTAPLGDFFLMLSDTKLVDQYNTILYYQRIGKAAGNTEATLQVYRAEFNRRGLSLPTEEQ
jgi:hypothetical protein